MISLTCSFSPEALEAAVAKMHANPPAPLVSPVPSDARRPPSSVIGDLRRQLVPMQVDSLPPTLIRGDRMPRPGVR